MSDMKFIDHAYPVLHGEPTIGDTQRESLWDLFHQSQNATELAARLHPMPLHPDLKQKLLKAKNKPDVEYNDLDRAVEAIHRMKAMDPQTLELAESHPVTLKAWISIK